MWSQFGVDYRSGLVWTIDAAFANEEDDIVFEFVGQGHAAQLQRTDPPGDFFGAEGGEHFVESSISLSLYWSELRPRKRSSSSSS